MLLVIVIEVLRERVLAGSESVDESRLMDEKNDPEGTSRND